jgi:hypothetical protein
MSGRPERERDQELPNPVTFYQHRPTTVATFSGAVEDIMGETLQHQMEFIHIIILLLDISICRMRKSTENKALLLTM